MGFQRDFINVHQDLYTDMGADDPGYSQSKLTREPEEVPLRVVDYLMLTIGFCLSGIVSVLGFWKFIEIIGF